FRSGAPCYARAPAPRRAPRAVEEIRSTRRRVDRHELDMGGRLIDSFRGERRPEKYEDTYRDELHAVIEAKRKGKEVHVGADVEEGEEMPDLLTVLRESVERSKGGRGSRRASRFARLDALSKQELDDRARKANIRGRSKTSKDELVDALRTAA